MLITRAEKRNFPRVPLDNCQVTYQTPNDPTQGQGIGKNVSGNGILFITEEHLSAGTLLEVNITPVINISPPLNVLIEVVRVSVYDDAFEIAGAFREVRRPS